MLPYVLPFALYLSLTQIPPHYPDQYAWLYAVVVAAVATATTFLCRGRALLRPHRHVVPGIVVGLVGITAWIGLCRLNLDQQLASFLPAWLRPGPRAAFNPWANLSDPAGRWAFVAVRFLALALLVPVVEELFWRGFLLRWLVAADWQNVKLGTFSWPSFAGATLLFTFAHPEWLAAAVYAALLNGLLYWKHDLWNCVVAHGISNAVLAIYILTTGSWELW